MNYIVTNREIKNLNATHIKTGTFKNLIAEEKLLQVNVISEYPLNNNFYLLSIVDIKNKNNYLVDITCKDDIYDSLNHSCLICYDYEYSLKLLSLKGFLINSIYCLSTVNKIYNIPIFDLNYDYISENECILKYIMHNDIDDYIYKYIMSKSNRYYECLIKQKEKLTLRGKVNEVFNKFKKMII